MRKKSLIYREELTACPAVDAVWTLRVKQDCLENLPYLTLPGFDLPSKARQGRESGLCHPVDRWPYGASGYVLSSRRREFIGARLAPGWGGLVLGVSPRELLGTFTGARQMKRRLAWLEESLFCCRTQLHASLLLRDTTRDWTSNISGRNRALQAMRLLRDCGGQIRVYQAARQLGFSPRTFRRAVGDFAGLSPKSLSRIFPFRRTLDDINGANGNRRPPLCDLAFQAGYTDQAHMNREFQALGGFTPTSPVELPGISTDKDNR